MLRATLSFCSILFLGAFGTLLFSVYCNFSMAQLELPGGKPIKVNWKFPRIDIVVEYNDYSVAEDFSPKPTAAPSPAVQTEGKKRGEEVYHRNPDILDVESAVVGDDVNGSELIRHYGFPSPDMEEFGAFDLKKYIDHIDLNGMLASFDEKKSSGKGVVPRGRREDLVSTAKSASKKNAPSSKEMIFIGYPGKRGAAPKPEGNASRPPPRPQRPPLTVAKVAREKSKKNRFDPSSPLLALASDFVKNKFFPRTLRAHSAADRKSLDFQFVPDHDDRKIFSSNEEGAVEIFPEKRLVGGILRGRILSPGHVRTVVNLPISGREGSDFDIPLIDEGTFGEYRDVHGGFLLAWISKKVEDVDVDNDYSFRLFLDEEFREVSQEDGYSYILFMGIRPGVTTLSYLLEDGLIAEKPVHVSADEILYDFSPIEEARHETFELYQKKSFFREKGGTRPRRAGNSLLQQGNRSGQKGIELL